MFGNRLGEGGGMRLRRIETRQLSEVRALNGQGHSSDHDEDGRETVQRCADRVKEPRDGGAQPLVAEHVVQRIGSLRIRQPSGPCVVGNIAGVDRSIDKRVDQAVDCAEKLVRHEGALIHVSERG
jgi:hypothetical protein